MGFDDLARHMAARDGRKKARVESSDPDQIVAEAMKSDRRMSRTRDLVLGPLLLVGGLGIGVLAYGIAASGVVDRTVLACGMLALGAITAGLMKTISGIAGRSLFEDAPEKLMDKLD